MFATAQPSRVADLIARYDNRTPRYTSYPTAVQFNSGVDAGVYRGWLADLPLDRPVGLYLHVPMCARLCWYCGCNTRAVNRPEIVSDYARLLVAEMQLVQRALPGRLGANAVHLGGGTPNMLSPDDMDCLFGALAEVFALEPGLQVAAELDPAVLTREWVQAAASHGLSRASLGVQNLAPEVQAAVNRPERFEDIARCVGWLREAGVGSINLDLMYGLPHQTVANTLATLDQVLALKPERLALFGYAHVPWMKSHQQLISEADLPGPTARLDQAEAAAERLVSLGYVRIGLDHFALPHDELALALAEQRLRRNFQGYTADPPGTLLGLGASAIGALPGGYVQNLAQETAWRTAVMRGELPVARGVALTADDRFRGEIIERLMCNLQVDLDAVCAAHGRTRGELGPDLTRLHQFQCDGLVRLEGGRVIVTDEGRPFVRAAAAVFDRYLDPEAGRHARAV